MINWITGDIHTGKTTKLKALYEATGHNGDGWILPKILGPNGQLLGYRIVRLSTQQSMIFALNVEEPATEALKTEDTAGFSEAFRFHRFSFNAKALEFAERIYEELKRQPVPVHGPHKPLWIDEIGPVELGGQGFHQIFSEAVDIGMEIYAVCRTKVLEDVVREYRVRDYQVIFA